ncbi:MAG: hypothetical protein MJ141_05405 [Clostridia bacterium]|nr:hypothetical protein [Clostridia bacterium]
MENQTQSTVKEEVREAAGCLLKVVCGMIESGAMTPSNVRNITGALKDVRELYGENEGKTIVIRLEGDDEWAK